MLIKQIIYRAQFKNITHITFEDYWQNRKNYLKRIGRAVGVELNDPELSRRGRYETPGIERIAAQYGQSFARSGYLKWIREGDPPPMSFDAAK
jgi:hypothetical protein